MMYEKPRRSAGLVTGGLLGVVAGLLLGVVWFTAGFGNGTVAAIVVLASACVVIAGLNRFFSAFDAAARHRWDATEAELEEHLRQVGARREGPGSDE